MRRIEAIESERRRHISSWLRVHSTQEVVSIRDQLYETARSRLGAFFESYFRINRGGRYWDIFFHYFLGQRFVTEYLTRWNNGYLNKTPSSSILYKFPVNDLMDLGRATHNEIGPESPYFGCAVDFRELDKRGVCHESASRKCPQRFAKLESHVEDLCKVKRAIVFDVGTHDPKYWVERFRAREIESLRVPSAGFGKELTADWSARMRIAAWDDDSTLEEFPGFWSSLALCLPLEMLEGFEATCASCRSMVKKCQPVEVISTQLTTSFNRTLAAEAVEAGIPLSLQQHGGGYGQFASHVGRVEERIADTFYTWGWERDNGNTISVPPHRLEILESQYHEELKKDAPREELLLILPHRRIVPDLNSGTDLDARQEFVLGEDLYDWAALLKPGKVVVRFRRQHGYDDSYEREVVEALGPDAVVDNQDRSIAKAYACAVAVIIVDPFTTSAAECEHLGIPYRVLYQPSEAFRIIETTLKDYNGQNGTRPI